jgi:hypothetical protein
MVKRNHVPPSEKANKTALTNGSVAVPSTPSDLPSFDEHALSNLTRRIENGLRKSKEKLRLGSKEGGLQNAATDSGPRRVVKERTTEDKSGKRGKKRDRQGDVKSNDHLGGGNRPKGSRTGKDGPKSLSDKDPELLQEILLLGGTREDLQLVTGVSSESEAEGFAQCDDQSNASKPGKSLQRDIEDFVKGLGITGKVLSEEDPSDMDANLGGDRTPGGEPVTSNSTSLKASHKGKLQSSQDSLLGHKTAKLV